MAIAGILSFRGLTFKLSHCTSLEDQTPIDEIDGLVQERRNSSALAMELRLSCINLLINTQRQ